MMFGYCRKEKRLPELDRAGRCPSCGYTARFPAVQAVHWLVLFFVPIPIPGKVIRRCPRCGAGVET